MLIFLVKEMYNEAVQVSIISEYTNLLLVVVLILESKGLY